MPIDLPAGYLTRPEAAKQFNRSQRALERDLNVALAIKDPELLSHWKLVTKDGEVREAADVSLELVNQLVAEGMTPAWCVSTAHLQEKYGRKGDPRPQLTRDGKAESSSPSSSADSPSHSSGTPLSDSRPDDAAFLRELVRSLEREKQQERERHDRIVEKLFGELDVKNRQISAWDEVTQGLTKALATGQIAPNQGYLLPQTEKDNREEPRSAETPAVPAKSVAEKVIDVPTEKGSRPAPKEGSRKVKTTMPETSEKARAEKRHAKSQPARKHKWNEFPTFKKILFRR